MATPTKEELKAQRELKEYLKTLKKDSEVFTGLAGGFAAVGRGVSTASKVAKTVKNSKRGKDAFNQLASKLKSFQSTAKTGKKTKSTVKEIVETKPTIPTTVPTSGNTVSNKIKSLYDQLSSGKPKQSNILESVKNVRELAEKQIKNAPTTTSNTPVAKELWKKPLPTQSFNDEGFRIGGTEAKSILSKLKDNEAARTATKKAFEKSNAEIIKKGIESSNKKITDKVIGAGVVTGVLGAGAGTTYYGMQLSNKDNKQTTGPVDLKRIDKNKLRDSNIEGVKTIKGSDGKDYGIKWNNTTNKWEYYKGGGKPVVKQTNPKQETVKENTGGGGYTPIKNDKKTTGTGGGGNQTTTTGGGGGTKTPVKPTVAPVTSTYVGDEYYKANPDLEKAIQEDSIRQQRGMYLEKIATKPLSSIVFKPTSKAVDVRNVMDEQDALRSIRADNKLPLKKKRYGGNLAMLKYMK